ncbi:MAG: UDP-N-acetylglucosamine 1-carboxyvinyltransferase [Candidatus Moranbacteria bacterium]|nr:UDP-N-acetylglucosamine 1-carboxyvinyltransferase [Candidatus Moranbacteria bacterium]
MHVFEITGGKVLKGNICVSGSKNAATPILAATLLTPTATTLHNIPRIEDVFRMLEILESMGVEVEWIASHSVRITPGKYDVTKLDQHLVKKLRSSILLLGALSATQDTFTVSHPGGCVIGARPVDTHMDALRKLGVHIETTEQGYQIDARNRQSAKVVLRESSVTATENVLMIAATLSGVTTVKLAACEPHVEDLAHFLVSLGVNIEGIGTTTLTIVGKESLQGSDYTIIPDANEAATFLILGAATGSAITVENAREEHLDAVLEKLREFGVGFKIEKNSITVIPAEKIVAVSKVDTRVYPGIPTDVQAPFGILATQAEGETLIHDPLFEGRFNYVQELEKMGGHAKVLNPHQVIIHGKTPLKGTRIKSYDLRAGAALIIAALTSSGTTVIEEIYQVDRGYERIEERLQLIGADIKRVAV